MQEFMVTISWLRNTTRDYMNSEIKDIYNKLDEIDTTLIEVSNKTNKNIEQLARLIFWISVIFFGVLLSK
jgi:hypothetical protein